MSGDQAFRLSKRGLVDRSKPLRFSFDSIEYDGYAGDTLASALLANGIHLVGRSFKYHRPRGILTSGSEDPNALVELRTGARREAKTLDVVSRHRGLHHFDGAASKAERHPHQRAGPGPVDEIVDRGDEKAFIRELV